MNVQGVDTRKFKNLNVCVNILVINFVKIAFDRTIVKVAPP